MTDTQWDTDGWKTDGWETDVEPTHALPPELTDDIAYEIDATRRRMPKKHKRDTDTALNILAMKVAGHLSEHDPSFNVARFATAAGISSKPQHLVSGEYLD
jgi:hypothetical protein